MAGYKLKRMNSLKAVFLFLARLKITTISRRQTIAHKLASLPATRDRRCLEDAARAISDGDKFFFTYR